MKKTAIIILLAVVILVAILIPALKGCEDRDENKAVEDSLLVLEKQIQHHKDSAKIHEDSAKIYQAKYENALDTYLGVRPGSAQWDSVVAVHKARIRAEIQRGDSGLSDPIRANKARAGASSDGL